MMREMAVWMDEDRGKMGFSATYFTDTHTVTEEFEIGTEMATMYLSADGATPADILVIESSKDILGG